MHGRRQLTNLANDLQKEMTLIVSKLNWIEQISFRVGIAVKIENKI